MHNTARIYGNEKHKRNSKLNTKKNTNTLPKKQKILHKEKRIRMEHNIIQHKKKNKDITKKNKPNIFLFNQTH